MHVLYGISSLGYGDTVNKITREIDNMDFLIPTFVEWKLLLVGRLDNLELFSYLVIYYLICSLTQIPTHPFFLTSS